MERKAQIKDWLKQILDIYLSGVKYQAFLFGSQANLDILKRADIDLGIWAEKPIDNAVLVQITNSIEDLPMLFKVDLVDFSQVNDVFKNVALSNMEVL
ncbi:nucleotidyltransferase domain-containing protein [Mucilaginibacter glaciei]|uniref:Nucleotidyltransferase domain-containing protein n=1 Tax=Mucilaginibacter glaciei TaxID=2772109 RepID=A0A926NHT8_9SPHI|nr:nucleotidyltransferase domain-containing protein [Mucilaginibacter glaciei]MBD1392339.1 nucleotidyltransferase domain-containing protein [Mucilaginibacter glaciei]